MAIQGAQHKLRDWPNKGPREVPNKGPREGPNKGQGYRPNSDPRDKPVKAKMSALPQIITTSFTQARLAHIQSTADDRAGRLRHPARPAPGCVEYV